MTMEETKELNVEKALQTAYKLFLAHGINRTTKEMVSSACGLYRPTFDRYFVSHTDMVLQVAEYIGRRVRERNPYPNSLFTDGQHTGTQLLQMYMERAMDLYRHEPRIFALRGEFKCYVYTNCEDFEAAYAKLQEPLECVRLLRKMLALGIKDGSISSAVDPESEGEYLCKFFNSFLSGIALTRDAATEKAFRQIERYIARVLALYAHFGECCGTQKFLCSFDKSVIKDLM